jgi:prevent-host-death family protein
MSQVITQRSLRNDNAKVMDAVEQGESFVVTRNGTPVAEIRPIQDTKTRLVQREALLKLVGVGPNIDAKLFRADLDAAIDQSM